MWPGQGQDAGWLSLQGTGGRKGKWGRKVRLSSGATRKLVLEAWDRARALPSTQGKRPGRARGKLLAAPSSRGEEETLK